MIISHQYGFVFVKTAKTAGTSIEASLSPICGARDVLTPFVGDEPGHVPRNHRGLFDPIPELRLRRRTKMGRYDRTIRDLAARRRFEHHSPAWVIRERAPEAWREYLSFCVVRNPWDVVLSGHEYYERVERRSITRDRFIETLARRAEGKVRGVGRWPYNYWNYVDPMSEEVLVDRIIRYEDLADGLAILFDELGVPFGGLTRTAKAGDRERRPLTPAQVRRVAEIYEPEIRLHGYSYDG